MVRGEEIEGIPSLSSRPLPSIEWIDEWNERGKGDQRVEERRGT